MQVSKAVKQKLPAGAQALIQWAEENNYSPVTSYTNTAVANIFRLRVKEAGTYTDYMNILQEFTVSTVLEGLDLNRN